MRSIRSRKAVPAPQPGIGGKAFALVAIFFVAIGGLSLTAQTRTFPNTTNGIFAYSDQFSTSGLSEAQFQFAATHYVGTQKMTTADAEHLREYNSNFLIMHYRLSEGLGYEAPDSNCNPISGDYLQIIDTTWVQEWPGDSVVKPAWFYKYAGQPRVYNCVFGWYLMNLNNASWRSWYSSQVIKELQDNQDDAVFADSFSVPNYLGATNWKPNLPVDNSTFEQTWATDMHNFTDYMRSQFAGRWLWIPNVGSWVTTRDPSDYTNVDGVMIEGFVDYGNENFLAPSDWMLQMNRALSLINLNKILIAQVYPSPYSSGAYERLYDTANYLLIKGNYTYLNLDAEGQTLEWWPEYSIPIGAPTEALPTNISSYWNSSWNVYERTFQNGIVLVNPTANDSGPIALGKTYYMAVDDPGGGDVPSDGSTPGSITYEAVTSVDLAPCPSSPTGVNCAAILLNNQP